MSWLNSQTDKLCTKRSARVAIFFAAFFLHVTVKAWDVDFSRRARDLEPYRIPASKKVERKTDVLQTPGESSVLEAVTLPFEGGQDIAILLTEKGFVPSQIPLRKNKNYRIHIVNVNAKQKNVSFVVDSFSENHSTYFGEEKVFSLQPKVEGVHSFVSPETEFQGKFVVVGDGSRKPAQD